MPPLWPAAFLLAGAFVWLLAAPAPLTGLRLLRTSEFAVSDLLGERPDRACFTGTVVEADDGGTVEAPFSGRPTVALAYQVLEERSSNVGWLIGFPFGGTTHFEPIDGGLPFLLADADRRTLARRLLVGGPFAVLLSAVLFVVGAGVYAGVFGLL